MLGDSLALGVATAPAFDATAAASAGESSATGFFSAAGGGDGVFFAPAPCARLLLRASAKAFSSSVKLDSCKISRYMYVRRDGERRGGGVESQPKLRIAQGQRHRRAGTVFTRGGEENQVSVQRGRQRSNRDSGKVLLAKSKGSY